MCFLFRSQSEKQSGCRPNAVQWGVALAAFWLAAFSVASSTSRYPGMPRKAVQESFCPKLPPGEQSRGSHSPIRFFAFLRGKNVTQDVCNASLSRAAFKEALQVSHNNSTLCVAGAGYETRAESQVRMLRDAVGLLNRCFVRLGDFRQKVLSLGDVGDCDKSWAYSLRQGRRDDCQTRLIPDFSFVAWPEAGLLPNYTALRSELRQQSLKPPTTSLCGWAGNLATNPIRKKLYDKANRSLIKVIAPKSNAGSKGGRLSLKTQVKRWACLIDVPAAGYSGRIPLLLSSGRPLLLAARGPHQSTDITWYSHRLKAWEHYIPVAHDLSDLNKMAEFVLGRGREQAIQIAHNAQEFANKYLSYKAAVSRLAEELVWASWHL